MLGAIKRLPSIAMFCITSNPYDSNTMLALLCKCLFVMWKGTCKGGKYFSCLVWWLRTFFKDNPLAVTPTVNYMILPSIIPLPCILYGKAIFICSSHVIHVLSHTNNFIYYFQSSFPANYDNINVYHILWQNIDASFIKGIKHALYFELDFSGKADDELVTLRVIQSKLQMNIQFRTHFLATRGGF